MDSAKNPAKPRPIIVLGPERSGTSVVAEMICRWGAYAGEPDKLRKADDQNPRGYFEYLPIWDFLEYLSVDWWDACFQERVREKASIPEYRNKAIDMATQMEATGKPWVWKDPALSFFLPFWKQIWSNPVYVISVRNPLDTALSWEKFIVPAEARDALSITAANLLRWHYIMSIILHNTEDTKSKIFMSFEKLVTDPKTEAHRLASYLSSECGRRESDNLSWTAMAEAVHPELWHNRSQIPFDGVPQATAELKKLYCFVTRKIQNPSERFDLEDYPMHPGWRESVTTSETLARIYREKSGPTNA